MSYAVATIQRAFPALPEHEIRRRLALATFVNAERRYLYFEVPKAGCSTIKLLLHRAEGLPAIAPFRGSLSEVRRDMFIHDREQFGLKSILDFSDREQEALLKADDVFRFTVVRNPYARVASAWREKIWSFFPGFSRIYGVSDEDYLKLTPADAMPFARFLDTLEGYDLDNDDHHWRRQTAQIFFGAFNLRVGRLERLDEILTPFLAAAGFPQTLAAPPRANVGAASASPYTSKLAAKVFRLYRRDFEVFGYEEDSWPRPHDEPAVVAQARFDEEIAERNLVIGRLYDERRRLQAELAEARRPLAGSR